MDRRGVGAPPNCEGITMQTEFTLTMLEALASAMEQDEQEERSRILRLIRAYARIIAAREPVKFEPRPLEYSDEDGHWDSSYPPSQQLKDFRGPRLIAIIEHATDDAATSAGFYHDYRIYTTDQ